MNESWRETSRRIILATLKATEGQPQDVIDKALFDAYPFGQRKYHPYKIWCDEKRRILKVRGMRAKWAQAASNNAAQGQFSFDEQNGE